MTILCSNLPRKILYPYVLPTNPFAFFNANSEQHFIEQNLDVLYQPPLLPSFLICFFSPNKFPHMAHFLFFSPRFFSIVSNVAMAEMPNSVISHLPRDIWRTYPLFSNLVSAGRADAPIMPISRNVDEFGLRPSMISRSITGIFLLSLCISYYSTCR